MFLLSWPQPKAFSFSINSSSSSSSSTSSRKREREREMKEKKGSGMGEGESVTLEDLKKKMAEFARERDWDQFHSPRNLLLALVGEVGELSEIFQWKGEVPKGLPGWDEKEKEHLGEELSDAVLRKMDLNASKYPVHHCTISSSSSSSSMRNNSTVHHSSNGNTTSKGASNGL
ncbi:putative dCTP diphosphatase [Dioscorea sansibarensis]